MSVTAEGPPGGGAPGPPGGGDGTRVPRADTPFERATIDSGS